MNINIKATNIELTDAIKEYVYKRLEGLDRLIDSSEVDLVVHVEVGKISNHHKSGDIFKAEVRTHFSGHALYAVSELSDLYSAIDEMKDAIISEAKKVKSRRRSLIRRGGSRAKDFIKGFFKK